MMFVRLVKPIISSNINVEVKFCVISIKITMIAKRLVKLIVEMKILIFVRNLCINSVFTRNVLYLICWNTCIFSYRISTLALL